MTVKKRFFCIDAHTCGNPVRLVCNGGPALTGETMAERRIDFIEHHDWIRRSLMFEPRGHDMMSGSIIYPPIQPENDFSIIFIETSGCLPMCGHGTIGTITIAIEEGLIVPKTKGVLRMEAPAGLIQISYTQNDAGKVTSVTLTNVPSFLYKQNCICSVEGMGEIRFDIAYGGNFYAIVDPQKNFEDIKNYSAETLTLYARRLRNKINETIEIVHPEFPHINSCSHVMWTGVPIHKGHTARNAVFYGDKAIDRSPCGTGTSARLAQWYAQNRWAIDNTFYHESIIGSVFEGHILSEINYYGYKAIIPQISGWAKIYGYNNILVDTHDDPYALGFQVI